MPHLPDRAEEHPDHAVRASLRVQRLRQLDPIQEVHLPRLQRKHRLTHPIRRLKNGQEKLIYHLINLLIRD